VLLNILPGLRGLRAPLAAGYVWLLVGWLAFRGSFATPEPARAFLLRILTPGESNRNRHETTTHPRALGPDAHGTAALPTRSISRCSRRRPTLNGRLTAARTPSSVPGEFWTSSRRQPRVAASPYSEANG
jgi:hypothetical protein